MATPTSVSRTEACDWLTSGRISHTDTFWHRRISAIRATPEFHILLYSVFFALFFCIPYQNLKRFLIPLSGKKFHIAKEEKWTNSPLQNSTSPHENIASIVDRFRKQTVTHLRCSRDKSTHIGSDWDCTIILWNVKSGPCWWKQCT